MNICFVMRKIAGRGGGAERVLVDVANELAARGHHLEILSYEPRRVAPFFPLRFGVRHINLLKPKKVQSRLEKFVERFISASLLRLPLISPLNKLNWYLTHVPFTKALRRYLTANAPDVVVAWMPPSYAPVVAACRGTGIRVLASTHNEPSQDYENPLRWDPNPLDRRIRLKALGEMDQFAVLLPEYKDWYPAKIASRAVVIPNAVAKVDEQILASAKRGKLVLSVGRLADVKRHEVLIRAWAELAREFPDWNVLILGEGPSKAALQALIDELGIGASVKLGGQVTDIIRYYTSASILCHPAAYEGFPLAVTEALAAGLPVVGFEECSGLNRLVESGRNGLLVPEGKDLAASISPPLRLLMSDADLRASLSRAAPTSMLPYLPEVVMDKWEAFVSGCLES